MEKCIRCKKEFGLGSVIISRVEGEKYFMVHFFCATVSEVRGMYGTSTMPKALGPKSSGGQP